MHASVLDGDPLPEVRQRPASARSIRAHGVGHPVLLRQGPHGPERESPAPVVRGRRHPGPAVTAPLPPGVEPSRPARDFPCCADNKHPAHVAPPEERHDDPRRVLIDALDGHQKRDIKSCDCGTFGSDHGHLGQRHSVHVADVVLAELKANGFEVVRVAETGTEYAVRYDEEHIRIKADREHAEDCARIVILGYDDPTACQVVSRWVGPWRPVGEDDVDAH